MPSGSPKNCWKNGSLKNGEVRVPHDLDRRDVGDGADGLFGDAREVGAGRRRGSRTARGCSTPGLGRVAARRLRDRDLVAAHAAGEDDAGDEADGDEDEGERKALDHHDCPVGRSVRITNRDLPLSMNADRSLRSAAIAVPARQPTSTRRGPRSGAFGTMTVRTPSRRSAEMRSTSTGIGSANERANSPWPRSTW